MSRVKIRRTLAWLSIALSLSVQVFGSETPKYPLMEAAQKGDVELVRSLLAQGQEANLCDSALHAAVRAGRKDVAELLLSHRANVNAIRWGNFTPLLFAVTGGASVEALRGFTDSPFLGAANRAINATRLAVPPEVFREIARLLIEHGADVNIHERQNGFVPLHYAIWSGDRKMVEMLLEHGAQPNPPVSPVLLSHRYVTPLHLAAGGGDLASCELLVGHGAEVNSQMPKDFALWMGNARQTPLHRAAYSGSGRLVEFLIAHGAEVNAADSEDETPLHIAAERKDRALVEVLLSHGADANRKSRRGQTPTSIATQNGSDEIMKLLCARHGQITIHSAASVGDVEAMERLVQGGVNVSRLDIQGQTALHAAATAGQLPAVEWLLAHGANVNLPDEEEATALSIALGIAQGYDPNEVARFPARKNQERDIIALLIRHGATLGFSYGMAQETVLSHAPEVASLLIDAGDNLEPSGDERATLLHRAAWWGQKEAVQRLLELGADVHATDRMGGTPLHAALQSGCTRYWDVLSGPHVEVVQLLIEHGASVNASNNGKMTPLHGAAAYGHTEAMALLLTKGAKVDAADERNATPLHRAATAGSIQAMELLITRGADPNAHDSEGDTPLLLLLSRNSLLGREAARPAKDFAFKLIQRGVQVDVQNKEGATPLQETAALGLPDLLEELLTRGAPVNVKSTTGWTALHSAVTSGNAECVEILLKHGAQVNALGCLPDMIPLPRFGRPARMPLHIAASQGDNRIVQVLIEHGADVNVVDGSGKTPLHLARENNRIEIVKLLSSQGANPNILAAEPWIPGRRSFNPISQAQAKRELEMVKSLAPAAPAALLTSLLFQEVDDGHSELIPVLVAHGADVNAHESLRWETPLHRAVDKKNLKAIELLLAHGADINAKDRNNETPLGAAAYRGQKETVSFLLSRGADVNVAYAKECEFRGGTALHGAVRHGYAEIAKMLVLKGANVNAVGMWEGVTPLQMAWKDRALLDLMLGHGGLINSRSADGATVLHTAAWAGQDELAPYLIAKGALVNVQDRNGNTPLHLAAKEGHRTSCEILIAHKADVNVRNKKGLLPLDYAQASGIEDVITEGLAVTPQNR